MTTTLQCSVYGCSNMPYIITTARTIEGYPINTIFCKEHMPPSEQRKDAQRAAPNHVFKLINGEYHPSTRPVCSVNDCWYATLPGTTLCSVHLRASFERSAQYGEKPATTSETVNINLACEVPNCPKPTYIRYITRTLAIINTVHCQEHLSPDERRIIEQQLGTFISTPEPHKTVKDMIGSGPNNESLCSVSDCWQPCVPGLTLCKAHQQEAIDQDNADDGTPLLDSVFDDIEDERNRQDAKWGRQSHNNDIWTRILGEEYGEVCAAVNDLTKDTGDGHSTLEDVRYELLQVAAVAVAWIQAMDRRSFEEFNQEFAPPTDTAVVLPKNNHPLKPRVCNNPACSFCIAFDNTVWPICSGCEHPFAGTSYVRACGHEYALECKELPCRICPPEKATGQPVTLFTFNGYQLRDEQQNGTTAIPCAGCDETLNITNQNAYAITRLFCGHLTARKHLVTLAAEEDFDTPTCRFCAATDTRS